MAPSDAHNKKLKCDWYPGGDYFGAATMIAQCILLAPLLIALSHASICLRSIMLIEPEEGQLDRQTLSPKTYQLHLPTNTTTSASALLDITPGTTAVSLFCRDAIVLVVRHGAILEICSPWSQKEEQAMNLSGIRVNDYIVLSVVEDVATLSPKIMRSLARLPLEFKTKGPKNPRFKRAVLDATAEGKLARTSVVHVEQDYEPSVPEEITDPAAKPEEVQY